MSPLDFLADHGCILRSADPLLTADVGVTEQHGFSMSRHDAIALTDKYFHPGVSMHDRLG